MIRYRNVLLATDFSAAARAAASHAVAVASAAKAQLHLLHVVEEFAYWESFNLKHFPSQEVFEELESNARIALADLAREEELGAGAVTYVRHGKPFLEIIRAARELEADMLVIGSHGQSGLSETLFGSTAEKVVRKAPCAVLVVRHPEHRFEMP
jgi:nucleotide-binding universal stress UspA family protein